MEDVVSESFFQFSEEKKRLFALLTEVGRDSREPKYTIEWTELSNWSFSPSESVRSKEILDVFERYLDPIRVTTAGTLLPLLIFASRNDAPSSLRRAANALRSRLPGAGVGSSGEGPRSELIFYLDGIMCDAGRLRPGQAFATYRKRIRQ